MSHKLQFVLAALLLFAVALMTVFPAATGTGSFQAVNGPTSVFQAWRAMMLIFAVLLAFASLQDGRVRLIAQVLETSDITNKTVPLLC